MNSTHTKEKNTLFSYFSTNSNKKIRLENVEVSNYENNHLLYYSYVNYSLNI